MFVRRKFELNFVTFFLSQFLDIRLLDDTIYSVHEKKMIQDKL